MKKNLKIIRADDTAIRLKLTQNNEPYSLDGVERVDLHAKAKGKLVLQLSSTDDTILVQGNEIVLNFTHAKTAKARWQYADYDVQIVRNGKVKTILFGEIELQHDMTEVSPN